MQQSNLINGIIIHSISGFYYVEAAGFVYECKAKGAFRKEKLSPLVGDNVLLETDGDKGFICKINDRKNFLVRPPIANVDFLFIVASADKPKPNLYVIDKMTAFSVYHRIEPVIVFSKTDLGDVSEFADIYKKSGFNVICCSSATGEGIDSLKSAVSKGVCAFTGNSGVGKSSIINSLIPELNLETNEISDKLGRGKHTTRSVKLYRFGGGYIADTPGFSAIDFENTGEKIFKDDLADCFPEFNDYIQKCKFYPSCSHTSDKGCAVLNAVNDGIISKDRHISYCRMFDEVKNFKSWM
ncbi:MAG: ribosome small subunit-dependent GTPase A [Oscillospiraceae bacterium]|nr:ribosome small subunit-dependent GTPase A [Oscillospiraceae bacterium]